MSKARWQAAYDAQTAPDRLEGGLREFNGYRHPRTYALLLASLKQATQDWQGLNVLDAGCGSGDTGRFLCERNHVIGIDFSRQMARYALRNYPAVAVADVEWLPFAGESFDGLLATGVWQCLPPQTPFLREVRRVLKPQGEAVFGWVLNREYLLYRRGVRFRLDPSVSMNLLTEADIARHLSAAGLRLIAFYPVLFPLGVLKRQRGAGWLRPLVPAYTVKAQKIT